MSTTLADVVGTLESTYPGDTAQSWDQVGLVTGDLHQPVRSVLLAVDPTADVIAEARDMGADMIVTHHPLLLRGVNSVATTTAKGRAVTDLVVSDIALFCAHTNADVATDGVCDALAAAVGLTDTEGLVEEEGQPLGRIGDLADAQPLRQVCERLAAAVPEAPVGLRVSGSPDHPVRRIAVLGGAGDSHLATARQRGADLYVTADLRHHPASECREDGPDMALVDAGHWASEWLWLPRLAAQLEQAHPDLDVTVSTRCTDPWTFLVPTGADGTTKEA